MEAVQLLIDLGVDVNDPEAHASHHSRSTTLPRADGATWSNCSCVPVPIRTHETASSTPRPSGWAHHQGHADIAQYLASLEVDAP